MNNDPFAPLPDDVAGQSWMPRRSDGWLSDVQRMSEPLMVDGVMFRRPLLHSASKDLPVIAPATDWMGREVPRRDWLIEGWLARGTGALLTGTGGVGKSLAAQQVATCFATGTAFLGLPVTRTVALYVTCEDDADELHRRQSSINEAIGVEWADLVDLRLVSLVGAPDNELMTFAADGTAKRGPLFDKVKALALNIAAGFVALDHVAHLFGGNENDRHQVTAFLNLLNALALDIGGTVMALGHENKAGANYSGSTAWQGGVRQHWHLAYPEDDDGAVSDPDARVLSRPKANYAQRGNGIGFRWHRGAFVRAEDLPRDTAAENAASIMASADNATFIACLNERNRQKRPVSEAIASRTYAPKEFADMAESKRIGRARLEAAMDRLFRIGAIERGFLWRDGNEGKDKFGLRRVPADPAKAPADLSADHPLTPPADHPPTYPPTPPTHTPSTTYYSGAAFEAHAPDDKGEPR